MHHARWMAKALYTLKTELLHTGSKQHIKLTERELVAIQRFNRFVILIYLQAWFTCNSTNEASINDLKILERLNHGDDKDIGNIGTKWHAWYLSPEMATLAIFSTQLSCAEKQLLVDGMTTEHGPHLLTELPSGVSVMRIFRSFFDTVGSDTSFLSVVVDRWCETMSYQQALKTVKNLPCINDCAERGVALVENFNDVARDESQKQCVLQVVEKHRKTFSTLTTDELLDI